MRRLYVPLALIALASVMFASWMHLGALDPRQVGWLLDGNDHGQNSIGLIAYLRARAFWPSLHDPLLMAPEGLNVALTDSNPLLALVLRPFAGWLLPDGWQYAGLWLFACLMLQVSFAWALIRPFTRDRMAAFVATALLAGTPVLFARYGHLNLCAQWLILWALWLFIDRRRSRLPFAWAAALGVSGLIHPYLLIMVAAIWASALLRLAVTEPQARRLVAGTAALGTGTMVAVAWWLGYLAEPLASTGTYGGFGLALDALWNPGNDGYSALLPAAAWRGAQGFEGMNYLGAGLLLLTVLACYARARGIAPRPDEEAPALRSLLWLLPAFAVLTLVAIGPALIWRGQMIATIPLPPRWIDVLDPVRASGRMFWPVYYAIAFASLAIVCRMQTARLALSVALILQLIDIAPMLVVIRGLSARADQPAVYYRTTDPRWAGLVAGASAIEIHPYEAYRDLAVLEEVSWRAITACRPVPLRYFYASREPRSIRERMERDAVRLSAGEIDPSRLYVFLKDAPPPAVAARAQMIDGIAVIAPTRPLPAAAHCA
ncbi:DUF6311 domain-containing protein [Sphingomonas sp.]|uniref:DUF6311 domain-containing protein n=1 Tax=Sphingomonas sp. TaxID=28214 RepID=UPI003D6C96CF